MSDLATLSAKKLREVIARRDSRWQAVLDQTIAAGMGDVRFYEMVELAKGSSLLNRANLARDYLNAHRDWKVAKDELDRRAEYHGSDKPIRRHRYQEG